MWATFTLLPRTAAQPAAEPAYAIEVDRLDGVGTLDELDDFDLLRARSVIDSVKADPLPDPKVLTKRLAVEFGAATLEDAPVGYVWRINPATGEWEKVCYDNDRIVVAPEADPNPIVVRLKSEVVLD